VSGDRVGYTMVLSDYVCRHRIRGVGQIDRVSVSRLELRLMSLAYALLLVCRWGIYDLLMSRGDG
jgi:hypothetical protein